MDFNIELTSEEIAICEELEKQRELRAAIAETTTELRNQEYKAEAAKAQSSLEAYWAGSASASVARDVRKGRVKKI